MKLTDFDYDLPEELIAHFPLPERSDSRLLSLKRHQGDIAHRYFRELPELLNSGDLLVLNDTRVIPARLLGNKLSGGKIEVLVERILDDKRALVYLRSSKPSRAGTSLILEETIHAQVIGRHNDLYELQFLGDGSVLEILESTGHIPLPLYIKRRDELLDHERYQTVYARHKGSVAAPTAGLHFDKTLLQQLTQKGIETGFVTLHVGAGTFAPVRTHDITQHKMHAEYLEVSLALCEKIAEVKARGNRVIAVGTTAVRSLETAAANGQLQPYCGNTQLFIYPGYSFRCVDGLITNFHVPQSSLLMLVCAFAGYEETLNAYRVAVEERYRFFSYGDAMLCL